MANPRRVTFQLKKVKTRYRQTAHLKLKVIRFSLCPIRDHLFWQEGRVNGKAALETILLNSL